MVIALQPSTRRQWASGLWAWLVVAMVLSQTLGFMHTIVHALAQSDIHQSGNPSHSLAWPAEQALAEQPGKRLDSPRHAQAPAHAVTAWLAQAFNAHGDASDCRLYDQFSHGDSLPTAPVLCMPPLALPVSLQVFEASLPLAAAALVRARGPPSIR